MKKYSLNIEKGKGMPIDPKEKIREIEKHGLTAQGRKELIKFLRGDRLTRGEAIKSKCYDCMGYYSDGRADCKQFDCGLYGYHPYAKR